MLRAPSLSLLTLSAALFALAQPAMAADGDPCLRFTWDVTRELAVMAQAAQTSVAGTKSGNDLPVFALDTLYDLQLAPQASVIFIAKPAKPTLDDGAQAGLVRFKTTKAGRYRIAITSGHWIDVIEGETVISSRDFQGQRGCERPRKIVEYELPGEREFILQLSGTTDARVAIAVTSATMPTK